jgi:hypothetical protein
MGPVPAYAEAGVGLCTALWEGTVPLYVCLACGEAEVEARSVACGEESVASWSGETGSLPGWKGSSSDHGVFEELGGLRLIPAEVVGNWEH